MKCRNDTGKEVLVRFDGKDGLYFWKVILPGTIIEIPEYYARNLGFTLDTNGPVIEELDPEEVKKAEQIKNAKALESAVGKTKVETKVKETKKKEVKKK